MTDWLWDHSPRLAKDFRVKYDESFMDTNRSNATETIAAALNYSAWVSSRIQSLMEELNLTQSPVKLFENFTRLELPDFRARNCSAQIESISPLLMDSKLTTLYTELGLSDGSLTYLNTSALSLAERIKQAVTFALDCILEAVQQLKSAFTPLSVDERRSLRNNATLAGDYAESAHNLTSTQEAWLLDYFRNVSKIDMRAMANASTLAIDLALDIAGFLTATDRDSITSNVFIDRNNTILLGSNSGNTYDQDQILLIDMGGDDTYRNNAGGAKTIGEFRCAIGSDLRLTCPIAVLMDLSESADSYTPTELVDPVIGSGSLGVGMLYDEGGNDFYHAARWMGAGSSGAGILIENGGSDTFAANRYTEDTNSTTLGSGVGGGIGFLLDLGGDDQFWHAGPDAMGWGSAGGWGALFNKGGNDIYNVTSGQIKFNDPISNTVKSRNISGPAQGIGEAAAFGILWDDQGDDSYACDKPVNYGCQGAAVVAGIGLLVDGSGNDVHFVNHTDAEPARSTFPLGQGGANIGSIAVLYDQGTGSDKFVVDQRGAGFGACMSVGILIDTGGADLYEERNVSDTALGFGRMASCTNDPSNRGGPGVGLLRDDAGTDTYTTDSRPSICGERTNNRSWRDQLLGVGVDREPGVVQPGCTPVWNP